MKKWYFLIGLFFTTVQAQDSDVRYSYGPVKATIDSPQPYFKVLNKASDVDQIPLLLTTVDVQISGLVAEVEVTQYYKNDGQVPLEAQYVFPGSPGAAVYHLDMQVGERLIEAEVEAKKEARKTYEKAKSEGKTASLLEQGDPGLFTMNVANILPQDDIRVTLRYTEKVIPRKGKYQFKYPAVGRPSVLARGNTGPQHYVPGQDMGFDLSLTIDSPIAINSIAAKNHAMTEEWVDDKSVTLMLDINESLDFKEDFMIEYDLRGAQMNTGMLLYEEEDTGYFLMMMQPPAAFKPDEIVPREYIFVVDSSGSMGYDDNRPIENAKYIASALMTELSEQEYFNVVLFAGGSEILSPSSLQATEDHINKGLEMVDISSAGGSTNLKGALEKINQMPAIEGVSRSLIVLTDGAISVPDNTIALLRNTPDQNVFVIGVSGGLSNDNAAIKAIGKAGQGESFYVTDDQDIDALQAEFLDYVRYPLLTDIQVETLGFNDIDVYPKTVVDLFSQKPLYLTGKYSLEQRGSIEIKGQGNGKQYQRFFDLDGLSSSDKNAAIKYLWAKEKISLLELDSFANEKSITELGLSHNLLTQFTSFVAVDQVVRNEGGAAEKVSRKPAAAPMAGYGYAEDALKIEAVSKAHHFAPLKQLPAVKAVNASFKLSQTRPSITFILGNDKSDINRFYQTAEKIYRQHPKHQTEQVVTHLSNMAEVKDYLAQHDSGQPWGIINIVSHSSPWSGLSNFNDQGELLSLNLFSLQQQINAIDFKPISDQVIDSLTEVRVIGCALGRQQHMLQSLAVYLGGRDSMRPVVKAPIRHVYMNHHAVDGSGEIYSYQVPWFINNAASFDAAKAKQHGLSADEWVSQPIEISLLLEEVTYVSSKHLDKVVAKQAVLLQFLTDMGVAPAAFDWNLKSGDGQSMILTGRAFLITKNLDDITADQLTVMDFNDLDMVTQGH